MKAEPNKLIHASSPYLLQHAHNPVDWYEWGPEALEKAKLENKLLLVSIGYSACHWCHVMERESFELEEVAEVMNKHYVCIKVDREERPDIDQIYMLAIQLMTGSGGWPLNCICLPDQRPIYGGTYFRKNDWMNILENVAALWANEPAKALQYADRLTEGIAAAERIVPNVFPEPFDVTQLQAIVNPWMERFDLEEGGHQAAPKFPLPNNWLFMLRFSQLSGHQQTLQAALLTLDKMAYGGIYDQLGGGFARYSVDEYWHVPHFEKMLYDNGQLLSLYAEAYQLTKASKYRAIITETADWLAREMSSPEGLFYSALDADSEGVEGKFYVWDKEEIEGVLGPDAALINSYYQVSSEGNWEEEQTNILIKKLDDALFAAEHGLTLEQWQVVLQRSKEKLLEQRSRRVRPGLDDKCLTSWNAMTIKGLAEASVACGEAGWLEMATTSARFILANMRTQEGGLYRNYKNGKASIDAFLDDYAFLIDALISLYQADFAESWLYEAKGLTDYVIKHFTDPAGPMFFYTPNSAETLIARKHELMDNVIPASNSVMAQNLQRLGLYFDQDNYSEKAEAMLLAILPQIKTYGSAYSNWAIQLLNAVYGITEVAITGADQSAVLKALSSIYLPNKIILAGTNTTLPLLRNKESIETKIYICRNKACQLPVSTVEEALKFIN
ncbi:thioredoxin domain-containing protein [Pedobacter sp. SAFR-022]|uniref:thioredoxin domain-containing protein n=1 Tax=Pedobacter sp. SAFR-022 TaxID=3436861 RepID=UPI003F7EE6B6